MKYMSDVNKFPSDTNQIEYDDLYASYRELKSRTKHTKTTTKIKILLDIFEDLDDKEDKIKALHDITYFIGRLQRDIEND